MSVGIGSVEGLPQAADARISGFVRAEDPITTRPIKLFTERKGGRFSLLVVEDNELLRRLLGRLLSPGYDVTMIDDGANAIELLMSRTFDIVLCDVDLPRMSGVDMLRILRTYEIDVPVVLMTGSPSPDAAVAAIELGALTCIEKPIHRRMLDAALGRAAKIVQARENARMAEVMGLVGSSSDRRILTNDFERALDQLYVVYQPIVDRRSRRTVAYEVLMRTHERAFPHPGVLLAAAEDLGRIHDLGRAVRAAAAKGFATLPQPAQLFVNLHPADLDDPELYSESSPLHAIASNVVLEITERAALDATPDVRARVRELRRASYRIAVDDLGAGYAGLSTIAALEPDVVKLDMSLVRGIESSPIRIQLVQAMTRFCRDLDMKIVAEAIETEDELRCICELGCDYLQGYLLGRPAPEPIQSRYDWRSSG